MHIGRMFWLHTSHAFTFESHWNAATLPFPSILSFYCILLLMRRGGNIAMAINPGLRNSSFFDSVNVWNITIWKICFFHWNGTYIVDVKSLPSFTCEMVSSRFQITIRLYFMRCGFSTSSSSALDKRHEHLCIVRLVMLAIFHFDSDDGKWHDDL